MKPASHKPAALVWFRRDLRLADHAALTAAVEAGLSIIPIYILDDDTPGEWRMGGASRWWLAQSLRSLEKSLQRLGSRLILRRGQTERVLRDLIAETSATAIYFTRGYEPFQRTLEERLKWALGRSAAAAALRRTNPVRARENRQRVGRSLPCLFPFLQSVDPARGARPAAARSFSPPVAFHPGHDRKTSKIGALNQRSLTGRAASGPLGRRAKSRPTRGYAFSSTGP